MPYFANKKRTRGKHKRNAPQSRPKKSNSQLNFKLRRKDTWFRLSQNNRLHFNNTLKINSVIRKFDQSNLWSGILNLRTVNISEIGLYGSHLTSDSRTITSRNICTSFKMTLEKTSNWCMGSCVICRVLPYEIRAWIVWVSPGAIQSIFLASGNHAVQERMI